MDWKPETPPSAKDIAAKYRADIADGTYSPGARLPGAQGLAKKLGVALMTVQSAYRQLAEDGLVEGRPGSGTYVVDPRKGEPSAQLTAAGLRDLQDQLKHVTSQLSDLRDRVERLEAERSGRAVENQ
ncbi:winged helix-turn-helix domain-containing protein [Streptomyces sp. NPDC005407]|uniref:winged helix-turn-helix domain-containing protein n=1 Tax=Streptomyces sp. NPDC005407 TaxID=3155340 RepID=UPI00339DF12D